MRPVQHPQLFWQGFDQDTAKIAAAITTQFSLSRSRRRGVPKLLLAFDSQILVLRNKLLMMERVSRRARRTEQMPTGDLRLLRVLRRRLNAMNTMSDTMVLVQKGLRRPLYLPLLRPRETSYTHSLTLDSTLYWLHRMMNPNAQSRGANDLGCFSDIPLRASLFAAHAHAAYRVAMAQKRKHPLRFLDVVCGGGMRLLQASDFFDHVEGFDFD